MEFLVAVAIWGGLFYLLNKIFLSLKERTVGETSRKWRIAAWLVYIAGLPAWLIILAHENNWMVAFVEAGGAPSMFLGLVLAWRRADQLSEKSQWWETFLDQLARVAAVAGIGVSIYHLGFMVRLSQWVELGVSVGFLVGTYRLAKDRLDGYAWFFLMNASAGTLMFMQGYFWLGLQQVLSLGFVVDAYVCKSRNSTQA